MTNYPPCETSRYNPIPPSSFSRLRKPDQFQPLKKRKTEVISTFSVLPITILCLPFSVRRSEPVKKQLAVSRFRPPLLRYVRSVFAASSPDTRKIRVSGNKTVRAYAALCASAVFQAIPVSETVQYSLLKPSNEARLAVPVTPV